MQNPGPHLQRFWFYGSRVKPRFLYFSSVAKGLWWISLRNLHLFFFFFLNLWAPGSDRLRSGWGLTVRSSALPQHAPHLPSIPILWHGQFVFPQFYGKVLRRCIFKGAPCLFLWSNEHPSGRAPLKLCGHRCGWAWRPNTWGRGHIKYGVMRGVSIPHIRVAKRKDNLKRIPGEGPADGWLD